MSAQLHDAALSYLHFLAVLVLAGTLSAEAVLLRLKPRPDAIPLLTRIDALYGISAVVLIVAGGARVSFGLKDDSFYFSSHTFWAKIATFTVIGLISILPTIRFMRWRKAWKADPNFVPDEAVWKNTRVLVTTEVHLLALLLLFAALMARGIG